MESIISQLSDPASVIGGTRSTTAIFGGLEGWGIRRACGEASQPSLEYPFTESHTTDVFENRRDTYIDDELVGLQHEYDLVAMK